MYMFLIRVINDVKQNRNEKKGLEKRCFPTQADISYINM